MKKGEGTMKDSGYIVEKAVNKLLLPAYLASGLMALATACVIATLL